MRTRFNAVSCLPSEPDRVLEIVSGDGCIFFNFADRDQVGGISTQYCMAINPEGFSKLSEAVSEAVGMKWKDDCLITVANHGLLVEKSGSGLRFEAHLWHEIREPQELASITLNYGDIARLHEMLPKIISDSEELGD